ncbi:MAG: IPT/TIG domain-containing protein, partial [Planctomycetales bacterium]|nr:IPT/TIG domain-containing protein [Planctomycetales bacterium]
MTGTAFQAGATLAFGGSAATSVVVVSASTLTAVTPPGAAGSVNVTVTDPGGPTATLVNGFLYLGLAPALTSVSPATGPGSGGTTVTLTGSNFVSGATIAFGGALATSVTVVSATTATCTTPPGTGYAVNVALTNPDGQSATLASGFTYYWNPTISGISPSSGPTGGGTFVTATGTNFVLGTVVSLWASGNLANMTVVSSTTLTGFTAPTATAGSTGAQVTNPDGWAQSVGGLFTYFAGAGSPPPTLGSVSPASGSSAGGTVVTLAGSAFASGTTVSFGTAAASSVTIISSTSLTCVTPAGAPGWTEVTVTIADGRFARLFAGYRWTVPPAVTGVSPSSGDVAGGTPVTVSGTGFETGATVAFGSAAAGGVAVISATTITADVPAGSAGSVTVTVTNPTGLAGALASGFTYTTGGAVPSVTGVSPASGPACGGTTVTISGTGFQSGATVSIGGAGAASVSLSGSTLATAVTPKAPPGAAGPLPVTVTNTGGASGTNTSPGFTYLPFGIETTNASATGPDVALGASGAVHAVWESAGIFGPEVLYARSLDGGQTWSTNPVNLSGTSGASRAPRVAARGSTVFVVWHETVSSVEHVYAASSTDSGATWSSAASLVSNGTVLPRPDVAMDSGGAVAVAYLAAGGSGPPPGYRALRHVRVVVGTAGGSFSTPRTVWIGNEEADTPAIAADGSGNLLVAWASATVHPTSGGWLFADKILAARSADGGATFSAPTDLAAGSGAAYVTSPAVALSGTT